MLKTTFDSLTQQKYRQMEPNSNYPSPSSLFRHVISLRIHYDIMIGISYAFINMKKSS